MKRKALGQWRCHLQPTGQLSKSRRGSAFSSSPQWVSVRGVGGEGCAVTGKLRMVVTKEETPYFDSFLTLQIRYVHCEKKREKDLESRKKMKITS